MSFTTPNLYKFLASFGAVLAILGLLFYAVSFAHQQTEVREIQRKMVEFSHERESFIGKIKALDAAVGDSLKQVALQADQLNLPQYKDKIDLRTKQLKLEEQLLQEQQLESGLLTMVSVGLSGAGLLLLLVSLIFWAVKLQAPYNRYLLAELKQKL